MGLEPHYTLFPPHVPSITISTVEGSVLVATISHKAVLKCGEYSDHGGTVLFIGSNQLPLKW